ncbi:MAG: hypothetical protein ABIH49_00320 [archaeon]
MLYKLKDLSNREPHIYARNPEDIRELVIGYLTSYTNGRNVVQINPRLKWEEWWLHKIPKREDIRTVREGNLYIWSDLTEKQIIIPLAPDFLLHAGKSTLPYLEDLGKMFSSPKKDSLQRIKLGRDSPIKTTDVFVPEDVIRGLRNLDLRRYLAG